jgi:hypothetical protein
MRLSRTRDFDPQFILTEALWLIHSFKLIRGEYGEVAKLVTVHFSAGRYWNFKITFLCLEVLDQDGRMLA